MAPREAELLAALTRLAQWAPLAESSRSRDVIRALCAGFPLVDELTLSATVGGLPESARQKYATAMARGPDDILRVVEEAVESVVTRPRDHANMCTKRKRGRDATDASGAPTVCVFPSNREQHAQVRFTIYGVISKELGYVDGTGERVPLPALAETLVKLSFPGTSDAAFTWFTSTAPSIEIEEKDT